MELDVVLVELRGLLEKMGGIVGLWWSVLVYWNNWVRYLLVYLFKIVLVLLQNILDGGHKNKLWQPE